jgi:hypothetical protein
MRKLAMRPRIAPARLCRLQVGGSAADIRPERHEFRVIGAVTKRALLALVLCAGMARAGVIQVTSLANEAWDTCEANLSQASSTSTYLSLSASCGYPDISGFSSATVTQAPMLAGFSESGGFIANQSGGGPGASDPQGSVTTTGYDTQTFMASGSTGSGTLLLQFLLTGQSENDADTGGGGVDFSFTVNGASANGVNGSFCPTVAIGEFYCGDGYSVTAAVPFVFGTAFSISEDLNVIAGSYGAGMANFDVQSALEDYTLASPSGAPIPGATLSALLSDAQGSVSPEPATLWLTLLSLPLLAGLRRVAGLKLQGCAFRR